MSKYLFILLSLATSSIFAQKVIDVNIGCSCFFDFEDTSDFSYVKLDTNNVWIIDKNQKDQLSYDNYAVISDSNIYYSENLKSSFQFALHLERCCDAFWIRFKHKYDFNESFDGGIIETSYDNGASWQNIVNDTIINIWFTDGLYDKNDSIKSYNNQPGFTGKQLLISEVDIHFWSWFSSDIPVDTMLLRFTISSDQNSTNNEGWILDDFSFGELMVGIEEPSQPNSIRIYPNPSYDRIIIDSPVETINMIEIINTNGIKILERLNSNSIDISMLNPGIYLIRINGKVLEKVIIQ